VGEEVSQALKAPDMKILLVEDDELVRVVLAEALSDGGHEVVEATGPQDALDLADDMGPPNIVITDIDLGSTMNGFDIATHAHRLWPLVHVILISGLPRDHTGQALDPRDRYIQKPLSAPMLFGAIEALADPASSDKA
jgi:CheY-like chemotaxis protein